MKFDTTPRRAGLILVTGILTALASPGLVYGQDATETENAHALLDKVKKSDLDRQISSKQTEIDRLKQDEERSRKDAGNLQSTMDSTAQMIEDSSENLGTLLTESKKLEHDLAVAEARISAERQKIEGLRALSAAQGRSLAVLNLHLDETAARAKVRSAEMGLLQVGKPIPGEGTEEKTEGDLARLRKSLAAVQSKTAAEERLARDAMKSASGKLAQAESRSANAKRLAEIDPLAPPPVAEKTTITKSAKSAAAPEKERPVAGVVTPKENTPAAEPSTRSVPPSKVMTSAPSGASKPAATPKSTSAGKPAPTGRP